MRRALAAQWLAIVLAGCAIAPTAAPSAPTDSRTLEPDPATSPEPLPPAPTVVGLPTSAPVGEAVAPCPGPAADRNAYDLTVALDYAAHTAEVHAAFAFTNRTGLPLNDLAFGIAANLHPGALQLRSASVDGEAADSFLAGPWLKVVLPQPAGAGCKVEVAFDYRLNLPRIDPAGWGWRSTFGWSPRQTLLGEWYPALTAYRPGEGWRTWAVPAVGEFQPADVSRVSVELSVQAPAGLVVVGSAVPRACPAGWCFETPAARFFAIAVGDPMSVTTAEDEGVAFTSAYFPEDRAAGRAALRAAMEAYRTFTRRFGPIEGNSMTVVEADIGDGMEYSGLAFVGRGYFAEYDGTPQNYLTLITAHETAHQWWYGSVGNDPALEPWLDEALATYSELVYLNEAHPGREGWWWDFRVNAFGPRGNVGSTAYDHAAFRPYVNAVYLRGALMLGELHPRLGDEAFFRFLRAYAGGQAGGWASADDFWRALGDFEDAGGEALREKYFGPG